MRIRHVWQCSHCVRKQKYRCRWCWREYWHCEICEAEAAKYGGGNICAECYWRHGGKPRRAAGLVISPVGEVFKG